MLLNLMTYVLIPAYTLLFIKGSHLFDSNFSVHGNLPSNQLAFLLWGVLVGIYFYVLINRILMRFQEARLESILAFTSGASVVSACSAAVVACTCCTKAASVCRAISSIPPPASNCAACARSQSSPACLASRFQRRAVASGMPCSAQAASSVS